MTLYRDLSPGAQQRQRDIAIVSGRRRRADPTKTGGDRAVKAAWYQRNKARVKAKQRALYVAQRAERCRKQVGIVQRRRARQRGVYSEPVDRMDVFHADHGLCGFCGRPCDPDDFHVDHIQPVTLGGPHVLANLQPAHPPCNTGDSWMARRGVMSSQTS